MSRRTLEVTGIQNNSSAGARKTALIPVTLDIIVTDLYDSGATATAADISEIKYLLNTEPVRLYTGTDQDQMNLIDRMTAFASGGGNPDTLRICHELLGMKDTKISYSTTINTMSADPDTQKAITNVQLQWVDSTADLWRVFIECDDATTGGPGAVERFQKETMQVGASAQFTSSIKNFIQLETPERRFFRRGYFSASTGNLQNGDTVIYKGPGSAIQAFYRTKQLNDKILQDYNVRTLAGTNYSGVGALVIDTTETGISEMIDTMKPASQAEIDAKVNGSATMGGQVVVPVGGFDPRFSPSAANTLTSILNTVGRL